MREKSEAKNIVSHLSHYKPTIFLSQPRMVSDLLKLKPKIDVFQSVRSMVTAGEVLPYGLYEQWRDTYNIHLLDGFGSTEVGHIFISILLFS